MRQRELDAFGHLRRRPTAVAVRAMILGAPRIRQRLPDNHLENAVLVGAHQLLQQGFQENDHGNHPVRGLPP